MSRNATAKIDAPGATRARKFRRWVLPAALITVLLALFLLGSAVGPYLFSGAKLSGEIVQQLRRTTSLRLEADIPGRFDLLPRPHVVIHRPRVSEPTGAVVLEAEKLDGDVRLLPLLVGRIELSSVALIRPKLTIDLDAAPMRPDSLIGRAMQAKEPLRDREQRLGSVTLSDGTAVIKSQTLRRAPVLEAINTTLDWRDLDSPATLTGSLSVRNMPTDISAWIAQPARLMRGDHSAVTLHVHSAPIDVSANGDLVSAATTSFRGHLAATAPSIVALLDLLGEDTTLLAPFANVSLTSDAALGVDPNMQTSIDLQNLKLRADGNDYEGALALQTGERPLLSGTLATEQLSLAPFLHRVPPIYGPGRQWSTAPILGREPQPLDLDLRISATHMRLAPFTIDDAALAVMTRGERTEVALAEGKAYGGAVKGRFSVGVAGEGINLRGTGSISGADASSLSWDAFGRQLVLGTMTASFNVETSGDSPATLMRALHGSAKGSIVNGELSGFDLGRALREIQRNKPSAVAGALRSGRTTFTTLSLVTQITDGIVTAEDGAVQGADATVTVEGSADLGGRRFDAHAEAMPPAPSSIAAPGKAPPIPRLRFNIGGSFDRPDVRPDITGPAPGVK